jgi:hypothetical protein
MGIRGQAWKGQGFGAEVAQRQRLGPTAVEMDRKEPAYAPRERPPASGC